jgi:hypothetical protein
MRNAPDKVMKMMEMETAFICPDWPGIRTNLSITNDARSELLIGDFLLIWA